MDLSFIILAAGKGSRMQSSLPKVMHKVASRPMLGYIMETVRTLKVRNCALVIGPDMDVLQDYVNTHYSEGGNIRYIEQKERLGTGHAVKVAFDPKSTQDIAVMYGDTPFIRPATIEKMHKVLRSDHEHTALVILGFIAKDPLEHGRLIVSKDRLEKITEYLDCTEEEKKINICNSGIMIINGKLAGHLLSKIKNDNAKKEYYLTDLVEIARSEGLACKYLVIDELEAVAVNSREELVRVEAAIQNTLRNKFLANGVTLVDPETVFFAHDTVIEPDVVVQPYVFFGPGVHVKSGVEIKSFSHIEGATIGGYSTIGPYARIRPGTNIGHDVKVGNFVEIKNAKLESGVRISHLSYVGDAKIGEKVNIGAGVITCNYDGFNKHQTIIGKNSFIGSNSALIAPVNIGEDVLVGAGSVITNDVPSGDLALSRTTQENLAGKARIIRDMQTKKSNSKPKL